MSAALVDTATLQAHVDTCTVCESVYANPGELTFEPETQSVLETLKVYLELTPDVSVLDNDLSSRLRRIKALTLSIHLAIDNLPDTPFPISVRLPLFVEDSANGLAEISLQTPAFLSRADGKKLVKEMMDAGNRAQGDGLTAVDNAGYIMDVADRITTLASTLWQSAEAAREAQLEKKVQDEDDGELQRVWFWFPSLSTREKRKDLVNYAARWALTGFVLAGKPGLLCLEGTARQAEDYMSAIKSQSWGDIPSYQKKVTERYRQPIKARAFTNMQEITHLIDQHGQRGNRGDMSQVRGWMETHGVGDAWGSVVVNTGVGSGNA